MSHPDISAAGVSVCPPGKREKHLLAPSLGQPAVHSSGRLSQPFGFVLLEECLLSTDQMGVTKDMQTALEGTTGNPTARNRSQVTMDILAQAGTLFHPWGHLLTPAPTVLPNELYQWPHICQPLMGTGANEAEK